MNVFRAVMVFMVAAAPGTALAQVGHEPRKSPYRDLEEKHEATLIAGQFFAKKDPAGVAPRGGTLLGGQYSWRMSGPAHLVAEIVGIDADRTVIDPSKPVATRATNRTSPLLAADVSLGMSLTGARSWHSLVPMVRGGVGMVTDFKTGVDSGGFKFGTRFAFVVGTGIRWMPGSRGRLQLRVDVTDRLYTIAYPETYYVTTGDNTPVVSNSTARKRWTNNPAITLGASYLFGR